MLRNKLLILIVLGFINFNLKSSSSFCENLAKVDSWDLCSDSSFSDDSNEFEEFPKSDMNLDFLDIFDQLLSAIIRENADLIEKLLSNNPDLDFSKNNHNTTLLYRAVEKENLRIVQLLLRAGMDPNIPNNMGGEVPLHPAVDMQNFEIIEELLKNKANPNKCCSYGFTPLHKAVSEKPTHEILSFRGRKIYPKKFAKNRDPKIVEMLLKYNADPTVLDPNVQALWDLTQNEEVKKILFNYCDPSKIKSTNDIVEMFAASQKKDIKQMEYLLKNGANPNFLYGTGFQTKPLLHHAAEKENLDMVKMLLDNGANIDQESSDKQTPLHVAVMKKCFKIVNELIRRKADLNKLDFFGSSALHMAAKGTCFETVQLLLEQGADFKIQDRNGNTPLHLAFTAETTKILLDYGADQYILNNDKQIPLTLQGTVRRDPFELNAIQNEYEKYLHTKRAQKIRKLGFCTFIERLVTFPLIEEQKKSLRENVKWDKVNLGIDQSYTLMNAWLLKDCINCKFDKNLLPPLK